MTVVCLAGGTGGAKLARGLLDVAGEALVVVANVGDDVVVHEAYVSPDPDLVLFWLADRIDDRGWGLAGDTFHAMAQLRELGEDVWFELGDRDLAIGLHRARRLREGWTPTRALDELRAAFGVRARVLPPCDEPLRTWVNDEAFQSWMIRRRGEEVRAVRFEGAGAARATAAVLEAVAGAEAIVVGPSNPVISIDPILAVPGLRAALRDAPAPVVAVSPVVGGEVLKGPTAAFLRWAGAEVSAAGVAAHYGDLLDGVVADEPVPGLPCQVGPILLDTPQARADVARDVLSFARSLA